MTIAEIMNKMIGYSNGHIHDIDHLMRVWTYAKTIGELEGLDEGTQFILETSAIVHDIACPLCREKYGNTNGKHQEREGMILVKDFFKDSDLTENQIQRIIYLVGHHHTFHEIDGLDYQILVEADYIANAMEEGYSKKNLKNFMKRIMKTKTAIQLTKSIFQIKSDE